MKGDLEKPTLQQMKKLREMHHRGEITTKELLKRVAKGRFDHARLKIQRKYRELFKQCREG